MKCNKKEIKDTKDKVKRMKKNVSRNSNKVVEEIKKNKLDKKSDRIIVEGIKKNIVDKKSDEHILEDKQSDEHILEDKQSGRNTGEARKLEKSSKSNNKNLEKVKEEENKQSDEISEDKDKKKFKKNYVQVKEDDKLEEEDINEEIKNMLKSKSYNKKTLEQKIELSWMDVKNNFVKLLRQKSMYNIISLLYNKGNTSTRYDILSTTLINIIEVSQHEYSKQFIIMIAQSNKKYLVTIIKRIKEVCKDICSSRNGLFVLNEIYKMSNRKCRKEIINRILNREESKDEEKVVDQKIKDEEKVVDQKIKDEEEVVDQKIEDEEKVVDQKIKDEEKVVDQKIEDEEEVVDQKIEDEEVFSLIKKLSSKRLWKFEVTHHILLDFLMEYPNETEFIFDLFLRNKQMNLLVKTYKGLEVCINLLSPSRIPDVLRILSNDFVNVVNNEYGVIYILKILEMNTEDMKYIVDLYTEKYKEIFIEEVSVLPLLYIFNQERKYYPTLFNHLRSKEIINIDKTYLLKKYKEIIKEHLTVFMGSFSYILVYFFCKKDDEIKKEVKKMFKDIPENEYTSKLNKKMIKYKLIK
jgi:hypothetical protein